MPVSQRAPEDLVFAELAKKERWKRCPNVRSPVRTFRALPMTLLSAYLVRYHGRVYGRHNLFVSLPVFLSKQQLTPFLSHAARLQVSLSNLIVQATDKLSRVFSSHMM
jgi:hypothetical protein